LLVNCSLRGETYWLQAKGWKIKSLRLYDPINPKPPLGGDSTPLAVCLKDRKLFWDRWEGEKKKTEQTQKRLDDSEKLREDLTKANKEISAKIRNISQERDSLAEELATANRKIKKLTEENETYERSLGNDFTKKTPAELLVIFLKKFVRFK